MTLQSRWITEILILKSRMLILPGSNLKCVQSEGAKTSEGREEDKICKNKHEHAAGPASKQQAWKQHTQRVL